MSIAEIADTRAPAPQRTEQREFPPTAPESFFGARRWGWRSGPCSAVAHSFEVSVEPASLVAPYVQPITDPLRTAGTSPAPGHYRIVRGDGSGVPYALYYDDTRLTMARGAEALVRFLAWHVNQTMIEKTTVDHVVLHAAAATRAGITVVLPGDQEHGKTTTVAGLLREGYGYVTDEAVAISPAGLFVHPFPKALSLDDGSWHLFPECRPAPEQLTKRQWQVSVDRLGSKAVKRPVAPPRVVVFPKYVAGSETRIFAMTRAQAVRELAQSTFHFRAAPGRNLRTLAEVARNAHVARLRIGALDDAVLAVEEIVSQSIRKEL